VRPAGFPVQTEAGMRCVSAGTIIRAKAPLRISFAGGGTDIPAYYEEHGGAVLSSTINRYAYVTLYPREDDRVMIRSLDLGQQVDFHLAKGPVYDGMLDLAKAAVQRLNIPRGIEMDIRLEAPAGSGLGGSSALTAGVIGVLAALTATPLGLYEMAELNYTIERIDLKIAGGKQDQYATTFGGFNLIEFQKERIIVNPLRIDRNTLNDLEAHFILCYTGCVRPDLGLVSRQVQFYREGRQETMEGLKRLHEMAYEMKEALLTGQLERFGKMLDEAYVNKKRMNPHVADGTPTDLMYQAARRHGALGGKLLGAGGGGYLLLFCETASQEEVRQEMERLGGRLMDFAFDNWGLQVWRSACR